MEEEEENFLLSINLSMGSKNQKTAAEDAVAKPMILRTTAKLKEKVLGASGSVSGAASILGSWQVCHNICLGIIAVLAVLGITVTGMPLLFLTKIAIHLWILAATLLLITVILYYTKKCFSRNVLLLNYGLVIAGIPFSALAKFQSFFWIMGGALATLGVLLYMKERREKVP